MLASVMPRLEDHGRREHPRGCGVADGGNLHGAAAALPFVALAALAVLMIGRVAAASPPAPRLAAGASSTLIQDPSGAPPAPEPDPSSE